MSECRFPAEWESDGAILLSWPHANTDWDYMLDEAASCFEHVARAIVPYQKLVIIAPDVNEPRKALADLPADRVTYITALTNDTWARDFGPITVMKNGNYHVYDFHFNGWGLKFAACYDNLITMRMKEMGLITVPVSNYQGFVLEGGGIESDGKGTIMTTAHCQLSGNRNPWLSETEVKDRLLNMFGAKQVLWLRHGYLAGDDTDSHIDTLARFAPNDTIIYVGCDDPDDEHFVELKAMKEELKEMRTLNGNPFNLVELPLPDPIYDENGERLPATYANFLITPNAVIMPIYNQTQKDLLAQQIMQIVFQQPIITVDCNALIRQHGSLHCVTMQMPHQILAI